MVYIDCVKILFESIVNPDDLKTCFQIEVSSYKMMNQPKKKKKKTAMKLRQKIKGCFIDSILLQSEKTIIIKK